MTYTGSKLRWRLRRARRLVRPAIVLKRDLSVRPTDVIIGSYPRSGSTWFTHMLCSLMAGTEFGIEEVDQMVPAVGRGPGGLVIAGNRRLWRTHEPYRNRYRTAVYLVRDPRDVCVSYWKYRRWLNEFHGDVDAFVTMFLRGEIDGYGDWSQHVQSWLGADANVCFITYEELVVDPPLVMGRVARFIDVEPSASLLESVARTHSIERLKEKERAASAIFATTDPTMSFVGSGGHGGWGSVLSADQSAAISSEFGYGMKLVGYRDGTAP